MEPLSSTPLLVATTTHGRVLVRGPVVDVGQDGVGRARTLLVCHGYGEAATAALAAAERIPGSAGWRVIAPQGLHRFYTKTGEVVASWMTSQDRELAIADNVAYVASAIREVAATSADPSPLVLAGFSQGAAMAWRAAVRGGLAVDAVIALGGDLPPDVAGAVPPDLRVLIGRGEGDTWYDAAKLAADVAALRARGVEPEVVEFAGGHEWGEEFLAACGRLLAALLVPRAG